MKVGTVYEFHCHLCCLYCSIWSVFFMKEQWF
jgi:hypothetical protein